MGVSQTELNSLTRRDPLAFGISYIDLLEDKQWEVDNRRWSIEPYQALNPWLVEKYPVGYPRRLVITKSTQSGISTMALTKMFHFATNWNVRIFYTLPRQQDVLDMVTTRVDPMISSSPYLKSKLSQPDSAHAKRIGNSYLFFMELSVEPRMMPADALYVDEVDLSDPNFMSTAQNRLDASRWKLQMFLSTPTVGNYGIHGMYINNSDMRQWLVKCPKCNHEQPIDWELNLRVMGPPDKPTKVFYGCVQCNAEISVEHIQTGRWVAEHPDRSLDTIGYHIHQMLTTPAPIMYGLFRDPQTKLIEFYRKRLGKPYELGGGSITKDDFLENCFDEPYSFESGYDGKSQYFMGVDQGNELQVVIGKLEPLSTRKRVVHIELVPLDKGFDRIAQLMTIYKVRLCVIDANPNRHSAISLVRKFPGRVMIADYVEQRMVWKTSSNIKDDSLKKVRTNVAIDRTSGFDGLMTTIKDGEWTLPGEPPAIPQDAELLIDQVTALKRDVETRKTQSGEIQVFVWRKLRADHLAHSMLYLKTAIEIKKGKNVNVAVIGKHSEHIEDEIGPETTYVPPLEIVAAITEHLAEVPKEQLKQYIREIPVGTVYELPFPLSYKIQLVKEYDLQDILWVMDNLVNQIKKKN